MKEDGIRQLKKDILNGNFDFMDDVVTLVNRNKILYSDNWIHYQNESYNEVEKESVNKLEDFMHLLYRGSKHSVGNFAESGFQRLVKYKGYNLLFKFYSGPDTFVTVEKVESDEGFKPIVTMELLQMRLQEAEEVKSELSPIIEKYLKAGLTFEEITKMFVEIMRENRIKL